MKLPEDKLSQNIRSHFEDMEIPMSDAEELWDRIEQNKKRRIFPLWWLGVAAGVLCLGAIVLLLQSKNSSTTLPIITDASLITNQLKNSNSDSQHKLVKEAKLQNLTNPIIDNIQTSTIQKTTTSFNQESNFTTTEKNKTKPQKENNLLPSPTTTIQSKVDPLSNSLKKKSTLLNTSGKNKSNNLLKNIPALNNIPLLDLALETPASPNKIIDAHTIDYKQKIKPLQKNKSQFYVEAGTQAYYTHEGMRAIDKQSNINGISTADIYGILRRQHFTSLLSSGGHLSMGYSVGAKLDLKIGINYLRTEVQFIDRGVNTERTIAFDSTAFYQSAGAGTAVLGGISYGQEVTELRIYEKVAEQRWSIPVSVSYTITNLERLSLKLNLGVLFNVKNAYNGRYLSDELVIRDHLSSDNHLSKSISYSLGLQMQYPIGENIDLYVSPLLRIQPKSLQSNLVAITRIHMGSQLGFRVKI